MPPKLRALVALLLAVLAAGTITISLVGDDDGARRSVTYTTSNGHVPVKVVVPKAQLHKVRLSDAGEHTGLSDCRAAHCPRDLTSRDLERDDAAASPKAPRISGPVPDASPSQAGCAYRRINANYSFRSGVRPSIIVLHYTVSGNRTGVGDVNAIWAFFNSSSTGASSNYVIDNEGHCLYMVAESLKAWAQAGFNSATACSIEVINTGSEPTYIGPYHGAGEMALARVIHDCAARWHIPLRRASIGSTYVRSAGVTDHASLGSFGGGHSDIGRYRSFMVDRAIAEARELDRPAVPARARTNCSELNRIRAYVRARGGHWSHHPKRRARAEQLKRYFAKKHERGRARYACSSGGATRTAA
jgi:hypothetical protein